MTTEYQKDYSLLRHFDAEAAKAGEAICLYDYPDVNVAYVAGPDKANDVCYLTGNNYLEISAISCFRMKPLCWVEGKPVYKGDILYNNVEGFKHLMYIVKCVNARGDVVSSPEGSGNMEHPNCLTWTKPVKKEKVKRTFWINVYSNSSAIHESKIAADQSASSDRIACVETEIEYEVEVK